MKHLPCICGSGCNERIAKLEDVLTRIKEINQRVFCAVGSVSPSQFRIWEIAVDVLDNKQLNLPPGELGAVYKPKLSCNHTRSLAHPDPGLAVLNDSLKQPSSPAAKSREDRG